MSFSCNEERVSALATAKIKYAGIAHAKNIKELDEFYERAPTNFGVIPIKFFILVIASHNDIKRPFIVSWIQLPSATGCWKNT